MTLILPDAVRARREELELGLDRDRAVLADLQTRAQERRRAIWDAEAELRGIDLAIEAFLPDREDALAAPLPEASTMPKRRRRTKAQMEEARQAASEIPPAASHTAEADPGPQQAGLGKPQQVPLSRKGGRVSASTSKSIDQTRNYLDRCGSDGAGEFQIKDHTDNVMNLVAKGEVETFDNGFGIRYRLRQPRPETTERA